MGRQETGRIAWRHRRPVFANSASNLGPGSAAQQPRKARIGARSRGGRTGSRPSDRSEPPHPLDVQRQAAPVPLPLNLSQAEHAESSKARRFPDPSERRRRRPLALGVPRPSRLRRHLLRHAGPGRMPLRVRRFHAPTGAPSHPWIAASTRNAMSSSRASAPARARKARPSRSRGSAPSTTSAQQHPRLVRRLAAAVALAARVERARVQILHRIADGVRRMALRQPIPPVRRQRQALIRLAGAKRRRHPRAPRQANERILSHPVSAA